MVTNKYEQLSSERKYLQSKGEIPSWYTTAGYQLFTAKYTLPGQTLKQRYRQIADAAGKIADEMYPSSNSPWSNRFYDIIWKGWLSPSTPVLANMGAERGLPVSCSGGVVDDSILGFYESRLEAAILTKHGFGTSSYMGGIRPRGSDISVGGKASGVLPVIKGFVQDMNDVAQSFVRRGSWAGYIEIDHGDFYELCDYLYNAPDSLNIGWIITDEFIRRLNDGDEEAISRYKKVMKTRSVTGRGYLFFKDKANRLAPKEFARRGLTIEASNLCVAGSTWVMTDEGSKQIKDLTKAPFIAIVNGQEYKASAAWSNGVKKVSKLVTKQGHNVVLTPDHSVMTTRGWVEAQSLILGDKLIINDHSNLIYSEVLGEDFGPGFLAEFESLTPAGEEEVYDVSVEEAHAFDANGFMAHNCNEIQLPSDADHTFSCVLSSMNASKYDEWKSTDAVFVATVFLDAIAETLIRRGRLIKGLENTVRFTLKSRALGLGVLGFHTYIQQQGWAMDDLRTSYFNAELFSSIKNEAIKASFFMASRRGEPEWCEGSGRRNLTLMAVAPNMSTAVICGGVSQGIEPTVANVYVQGSQGGEILRLNPVLWDIMKERGVYNVDTMWSIVNDNGSVRNVTWLSDEEKRVFKTAFEIDQMVLLRLASQRQKHIDQGQSLNLFFAADEDPKYISKVHRTAAEDPYIKGLYYMRSQAGVQASKGECTACEG